MLESLKIQNVALIPEVEIQFGDRFNVLTGETGAGKSIVIGSFNFILGEKLSKTMVRSGAVQARVDAVFSAVGADIKKIEELAGIQIDGNSVVITRTLRADGKSEARINGTVVTAAMLKDATSNLVHIHGQHEHEVLLRPKNHLQILDCFGGQQIKQVWLEYREQYEKLQQLCAGIKKFGGSDAERDRMIDMYSYQIKEIEDARLREGEDEELSEFKQKMVNYEKIQEHLCVALQISKQIDFGKVVASLSSAARFDSKIEKLLEAARGLQYEAKDIEDSVQSYLEGLEFDEEKFKRVDARLDEIKVLKRKYGGSISQIFAFLAEARAGLDFLTRSAEELEEMKKQVEAQEAVVARLAERLSDARKRSAEVFEREMVVQLRDLGMPACSLEVSFEDLKPGQSGADEVEFLFSANAGEPVRPLGSIISGGEMSRFMLALKTVTARTTSAATLVFDEIDTGVGGTMGLKIAEKIAMLAKSSQVIAVTHLAQIAAMADTHFVIEKNERDGKTFTSVGIAPDVSAEIARMLGQVGGSAREHAVSIMKWASDFKQKL